MAQLSQRTFNAAYIHNRIGEIQNSIEMLKYGLSELEALYLRINSDIEFTESERIEGNESVKVLNTRNNYLAHAIHHALKEVESNLKLQATEGIPPSYGTMKEFADTLRISIQTLQDYRQINETYSNSDTKPNLTKGNKKKSKAQKNKKDDYMSSCQKLRRLVKTICICGIRASS